MKSGKTYLINYGGYTVAAVYMGRDRQTKQYIYCGRLLGGAVDCFKKIDCAKCPYAMKFSDRENLINEG